MLLSDCGIIKLCSTGLDGREGRVGEDVAREGNRAFFTSSAQVQQQIGC